MRFRLVLTMRLGAVIAFFLSMPTGARAAGNERVVIFDIPTRTKEAAQLVRAIEEGFADRAITISDLLPQMRQSDRDSKRASSVRKLVEASRKSMLSLRYQQAHDRLNRAIKIQNQSFLRFYSPVQVADTYLLAAAVELEQNRPNLAHRSILSSYHIHPRRDLSAHYSPQVRAAYERVIHSADAELPATFSSALVREVLKLTGVATKAIIIRSERKDNRDPSQNTTTLRATVFDAKEGIFKPLGSLRVVRQEPGKPSKMSPGKHYRSFALRIFSLTLGNRLSSPELDFIDSPAQQPSHRSLTDGTSTRKPWFRRWYFWATIGTVIVASAAIALPLALKEDVIRTRVSFPTGER